MYLTSSVSHPSSHRAVMPGMVMFRRRWSVGSDDLVLPALFLFLLHCIWWVKSSFTLFCVCVFFLLIRGSLALILRLVVLSVVLFGLPYGSDQSCSITLVDHGRGYLGILVSCLICESAIMWLSMRGSILYTQPREAVQYVIYIRLGKTCRHSQRLSNRIISRCLLKVGEAAFDWFSRSEHCLY